jgi:hypothetical protein
MPRLILRSVMRAKKRSTWLSQDALVGVRCTWAGCGRAPESAIFRPRTTRCSGLSVSTVQRIWRAFGLQPHRVRPSSFPPIRSFVAKVRDVVGLYMSPPECAMRWVCSGIPARNCVRSRWRWRGSSAAGQAASATAGQSADCSDSNGFLVGLVARGRTGQQMPRNQPLCALASAPSQRAASPDATIGRFCSEGQFTPCASGR